MMIEKRAWKLRPGSDDSVIRDVLENGIVYLDYGTPGLQPEMPLAELIEVLRSQNPNTSDRGIRSHAGQIHDIINKVTKGDLALVPRDRGRSMMIGEIISDQAIVSGTKIAVKVRWVDEEVPISRFDQDLRYSFKAIHKFCGVSRNGAVSRITAVASGENDPGIQL